MNAIFEMAGIPSLYRRSGLTAGRSLVFGLLLASLVGLARPVFADPTPRRGASPGAVGCTDGQPPFVTDFNVYQPPPLLEPAARVPYRDPVFKTCVVRVTDRIKDIVPGDTSGGVKNEYSRVQSFNADESRILVRGTAATWYLYDAATLQRLGKLSFEGAVDPRWDATNPDLLYYADGPRLTEFDTRTRQSAVLHDFTGEFPGQTVAYVWTKYEGSPSRDGNRWGLMAQDAQDHIVAFLVYDQTKDDITARRDTRGMPLADTVDSVSISPLGDYFVAHFDYCPVGTLGTDASPCGFMVYDSNLRNGRGLLRIIGHSDLALDAQGREVLVYQDIDTDDLSIVDLAAGAVTRLWPIDFSFAPIGFHFSGRSLRLPGWATVSTTHSDVVSHTWMDDQVFVMELKPNGRVFRLAHTHSRVDPNQEHDYWAEPQASTNRDLTRILFTTNWGRSGTDEVEMYEVQLPAGWSGAPVANFTFSSANPEAGQQVQFTDTSSGSPTSWSWDFGNGGTSSVQNAVHTFSRGTYEVSLTASNAGGSNTKTETVVVRPSSGQHEIAQPAPFPFHPQKGPTR